MGGDYILTATCCEDDESATCHGGLILPTGELVRTNKSAGSHAQTLLRDYAQLTLTNEARRKRLAAALWKFVSCLILKYRGTTFSYYY